MSYSGHIHICTIHMCMRMYLPWEVAFGKLPSFLTWAIFQTELEVCITGYMLAVVGDISDVMYACLEMRPI